MFCSVGSTYLMHFVQSVSYSYHLVYISVFREWPVKSVHNWIGTMTLRTKAIILCRKLSGFHIPKSIWGTWELSLLALLTCPPLLPQPSFNCSRFFHLLTFESKSSVFEFHNTLSRLTDNSGINNVPVS